MIEELHFASPIYFEDKPEWVEKIDKACDKHLQKSKNSSSFINEMNKRKQLLGDDFDKVKDFAYPNHSELIAMDPEVEELRDYIVKNSYEILDRQGFDMSSLDMAISEFWVQEFPKGGHHDTHIHYNSHISGFYFLRCSDKTSKAVFHDPRPAAQMTKLPLKDMESQSLGQDKIYLNAVPGTLVWFNSYLPHQFTVDNGLEDFRFIHFNITAIPKQITVLEK